MRRRTAFTLVEVLVAMALTLFIMSILSAAFVAATQSVSDLKSAGDLAERLRGAANVLRRDLGADHFSDGTQTSPRLSDTNFWDRLNPIKTPNGPLGFFRIYEGQSEIPAMTPNALAGNEGTDLDGFPSYYQTTTALHYTIVLPGNLRSNFLSAVVPTGGPLTTAQATPTTSDNLVQPPDSRYEDPPNTNPTVFNSQLAEVAVFLVQNGDVTDGSVGPPQQLYSLYRRQFLAVPTGWTPPPIGSPGPPSVPTGNPPPPPATQAPSYLEVSTIPSAPETVAPAAAGGYLTFNDMKALTMPIRRFSMDRGNPAGVFGSYLSPAGQYANMSESTAGAQASADLLMSDVVSFDVRVLLQGNTDFVDLFDPTVQAYANSGSAFSTTNAPNGPRVFDTWSNQVDSLTGANYTQWNGPWQNPAVAPADPRTIIPVYKTPGSTGTPISIQALQITLRVWDFKTKKTRQVTMVQQM